MNWFNILSAVIFAIIIGISIANIYYFYQLRNDEELSTNVINIMIVVSVVLLIIAIIMLIIAIWAVVVSSKKEKMTVSLKDEKKGVEVTVEGEVSEEDKLREAFSVPPEQMSLSTSASGKSGIELRKETEALISAATQTGGY